MKNVGVRVLRAEPVSVTGMGCVCAAGSCVAECLLALENGERAPQSPTRFQSVHARTYPVFEVPKRFFADREHAEPELFITVRLALHAAREALAQAGLDHVDWTSLRAGVCIGTSVGASLNLLNFYRAHREGKTPAMSPVRRYLNSNPAVAMAHALGTNGPVQTVVNACSSGADAIGMAASWIRQDLCDVVIAGGADELSEVTFNGFIRLMISDQEPCRPFDRSRGGLNLGEGAGIVILESPAFRNRRKAKEVATVLGYGTAADAHHLTAPHPDGLGLKLAIAAALDAAGQTPADIAFMNAHGTGTPNNDVVEAAVFKEIFPGTPFIATKGMTGHTLGAAGAIEAIFTMAHIAAGELPASVGFAIEDPALGVAPTTIRTPVRGKAAISQSLAFGGNNSVLVVGTGRAF